MSGGMEPRRADLVLEGGGVKGIGLAGAVATLARSGYTFPRVAGSSAGAVVAAFVAALQRAGEPLERLEDVARSLDYRRLRDRGAIGRLAGPLSRFVDGFSLAFDGGVFEGDYLRRWLEGSLADLGVRTFGDLRVADTEASPAPRGQYSLVVTASDVSRRRLVRLPWDYGEYNLDPDEQEVADAVRASASIPFFFEPITLRSRAPGGETLVSTMVDGGVLSNFPVALFDRTDARPPRWPTFGVRLTTRPASPPVTRPVEGPLAIGLAALDTLLTDQGSSYLEDPCTVSRTVFVPTAGVSIVDFDIDRATQERLHRAGREAAERFLSTWDVAAHVRDCRRAAGATAPRRLS